MKALFTRKSIRGSISLEQRSLPTRAWAPGELYGECGVRGGLFPIQVWSVSSLLCAALREPLEMVLVRADMLHSDLPIPWFDLCLMPLRSQLKSLYLFDLWFFFFLILTEREFCMLWKFNHVMFSVLIGVFVKRMSNLFMHALLWYYNYPCHICLINAVYFVLLMSSLCFTHDHGLGVESGFRLWSRC